VKHDLKESVEVFMGRNLDPPPQTVTDKVKGQRSLSAFPLIAHQRSRQAAIKAFKKPSQTMEDGTERLSKTIRDKFKGHPVHFQNSSPSQTVTDRGQRSTSIFL